MVQLWRAFGELVPLFLIIVLVIYITVYFISKKKNLDFKRVSINILLGLSIIGILLVTVYPRYYGTEIPTIINIVPFTGMYDIMFHSVDITVPIRNLGLNILLFVPFGFFLSQKISSLQKKVRLNLILAGLLFSLFIEVVQFSIPMGRSADIDDLILNTVGAFLGYIIWKILNSKFPSISLSKKTSKGHM
ncbi:Glycopeptide antibiotics resistance protein [Alkalibacterium subtropicum]|uniref:Glycopeptide antibiotics resistance protein n=1 Tax=Alkalibacterium subtropicum TaxID=753702 RepID=A0A1I1I7W8_9LACT|nr:VanZ family protein [Alkalibacterium subtropicum]SFC29863.1 Glycopeptide antibiotics resistance protein [Alkalibacterium subtropicum]